MSYDDPNIHIALGDEELISITTKALVNLLSDPDNLVGKARSAGVHSDAGLAYCVAHLAMEKTGRLYYSAIQEVGLRALQMSKLMLPEELR